ncbi:MAG: hypothetical protein IKQ91_04610 [Oscillospiraceae bacterium]|nr:hypothetical protein [Oscillospiraceae bacterium]
MKLSHIKALFLREWRLTKKQFIGFICAMPLFCLFFWLIRASMSFGNLAVIFDTEEMLHEFSGMIYYMSVTTVAFVAVGSALSDIVAFSADLNANWLRYSYALPVTPQERAASSLIMKAIRLAAGLVIAFVNAVITAKISDMPFTADMVWFILAIAAVSMLYDVYMQCFVLRVRAAGDVAKMQVYAMMVLMIPAMLFCLKKMMTDAVGEPEFTSMDEMIEKGKTFFISHENVIIPATVIGFIVLPVLSFLLQTYLLRSFGDAKETTDEGRKKKSLFGKKNTEKEADAA